MSFEHTPKEFGTFSEKDKEKLENITKQAVESNTIENTLTEQRKSYQNPEILKRSIATFFEYLPKLQEKLQKENEIIEDLHKELDTLAKEITALKKDKDIYTELKQDVLMHKIAEAGALLLEYKGEEKNLSYIKKEISVMLQNLEDTDKKIKEIENTHRELEIMQEEKKQQINEKEKEREIKPELN